MRSWTVRSRRRDARLAGPAPMPAAALGPFGAETRESTGGAPARPGGRGAFGAANLAVVAVAVVTAAVLVALGGCTAATEPTSAAPQVPAVPTTFEDDCVVGTWRLVRGWQRLNLDGEALEINVVSGSRELRLAADGTGMTVYPDRLTWRGGNTTTRLEAEVTGRASLTYTAMLNTWHEVADATGVRTTLTLNGEADGPRPGNAEQAFDASYTCRDDVLVVSTYDYRSEYERR